MSESVHRNNHKAAILSIGGLPESVSPAQVSVQSTRQNLEGPVKGEEFERDVLYPDFIQQARQDNVPMAVKSFQAARNAEAQHDRLFKKALQELGHNKPVDYCVSPTTGATVEVPVNQVCPREMSQSRPYFQVR